MSPDPDTGDSYIRGGAAVHIDGRRVTRCIVGLASVVLITLTVVFGLSAIDHNSRITKLKTHGVPVVVTVTGCVGMASGTGITEAGFTCTGAFSLEGQTHTQAIGASTDLLQVGHRLPAVTVPGSPSILYPARAVATMRTSFTVYITPLVLLSMAIATALGWWRLRPKSERI